MAATSAGAASRKRAQLDRGRKRAVNAIWLLVGFAILLVVVEFVGRGTFTDGYADELQASTGAASVEATSDTFPLVATVLATGRVADLVVRAEEVPGPSYVIARYEIKARDAEVGRGAVAGNAPEPDGAASIRITVALDAEGLSNALGTPVSVRDGQIVMQFSDVSVEKVTPVVREGTLVLETDSFGATEVLLPPEELMPCEPTPLVRGLYLELVCTADEWPAAG